MLQFAEHNTNVSSAAATVSHHVFLRLTLLACLFTVSAADVSAQATAVDPAALRARFQKFDITQDGWLDGTEVTACGCMAFDRNGDREITWEEYRDGSAAAGRGARAGPPAAPALTPTPATPARPAATPAPPAAAPAQPSAAPTPAQVRAATYRIPDRVEVRVDGTWYPGSIYAVRDGEYKVMRDGYTSDSRWFAPSDLRPYTAPARPAPARDAGLPRVVPLGTYNCTSWASSSSRSGFGQISVTGNGQYTALARDGAGAPSRFTYDPASGEITWAGGKLQGFFGTVTGSNFGYDSRRTPVITVSYVVRVGGNGFDLSCAKQRRRAVAQHHQHNQAPSSRASNPRDRRWPSDTASRHRCPGGSASWDRVA